MAGFIVYDLMFLALFIIFVIIFLTTRKKNIQRQGILYLYRTQLGVNFIEKFSKKFKSILLPMRYFVLMSGYILMVSVIWLFLKTTYLYVRDPLTRQALGSTPPIAPLIPYFPTIFGLDSFLPPLYFTYFLIALAIVAVSHEFFHGIYMRIYDMRVKSTGFVFLGPILGAFVEQDEKQFNKFKKIPQMVVLAAGTFANVLMTILFGVIMILFFSAAFHPAGVSFDTYSISSLNISQTNVIGNSSVEGYIEITTSGEAINLNGLVVPPDEQRIYFVKADNYAKAVEQDVQTVLVYDDTPAFRSQLEGSITEVEGEKITSSEKLGEILQNYESGETVEVKTVVSKLGKEGSAETKTYSVELGERDGRTYLGVNTFERNGNGFLGFVFDYYTKIKDPTIYYESSWGNFGWFVYYLLWWLVFINFVVALFNMLPVSILDGGRFFLLTVWGITGRQEWGVKAYKFMTWFVLALLLIMMIAWAFGFF